MSRPEPTWRRYLAFWRPALDRDVDAEIRFHFEERVADLMARGRSEVEARTEAERDFGDRDVYREQIHEIDSRMHARRNRRQVLDALETDLRLSLRTMRRAPGLSLTVIALLGLGVGANGAIFSMLDRMFLRPPPGVVAADAVRRFWGHYDAPPPMQDFTTLAFNYPELVDMRRTLGPSIRIAGFRTNDVRLGGVEAAPMLQVADVVDDYFGVLGVRPERGRLFAPEEVEVTTPHRVAVISHRLWSRTYASDSAIIGRTIRLDRQDFTIVGVAARGFDGIDLDAVDVWRPANYVTGASSRIWYQQRNGGDLQLVTRLPRGANEADLVRLANEGLHTGGDRYATRTTVQLGSIIAARGPDEQSREAKIAMALAAVTLIVLLTAVANVANLLLTRAMQRRREVAVRLALGVSRRRLAAHLLTESAVLAAVAGGAAMVVGTWGGLLLRGLLLPTTRWADGPFDVRLVVFTFVVTLGAGLLAGTLPLMNARSLDLASSMRGGARDGGHRSRARAALIVAQAALSVVLLTGATLFLRSLSEVRQLDIGFDTDMLVARVMSGDRAISAAERAAALAAIRDRVAALPGVRAAGLSNMPPMYGFSGEMLYIPGRDSMPTTAGGPPTFMAVTPEFFRAAGVSILEGRSFTDADGPGAPRVAVITRTMARITWGASNAIGKCMHIAERTAPCTTIIGIMEDIRRGDVIEEPQLQFYLPLAQSDQRGAGALIISADPSRVGPLQAELQSIIRQTVPGSVAEVKTLGQRLDSQYRPWRVGATLFTAFGLLALLVAAIGVYSAISFAVAQRSHELGVRMALGARRSNIARIVIGSGLKLVGTGVIVGVVIFLGSSRALDSLLYKTDPDNPVVLGAVAAVLLGVAIIAAALPAWRATRLDPIRSLRAE